MKQAKSTIATARSSARTNDYFGEDVSDDFEGECKTLSKISSSSDLDSSLILGISKCSGLSSASSSSWNEEYESDLTKKALYELEVLDSIFQETLPCSSHYDMKEIDEWKRIFGPISIVGRPTPCNSTNNSDCEFDDEEAQRTLKLKEEIVSPLHSDSVRQSAKLKADRVDFSSQITGISISKIQGLNKNSGILRSSKKSGFHQLQMANSANKNPAPEGGNKRVTVSFPKPNSLDLEKYLRISSIKSPQLSRRQSSKVLRSVQTPSDFVMNQPATDFKSLPLLSEFTKRCTLSTKSQNRKVFQRTSRKKSDSNLVLPPIDLNYRSISATPRQANKLFSSSSACKFSNIKPRCNIVKFLDSVIPISNR